MAAKFISSFLLGIIFCSFGLDLYAQTGELRGFDQSVFEYHFDRADRAEDAASWLREARYGMELAAAGWEPVALELYDDPEERSAAREELKRLGAGELERRYREWLYRRFFSAGAGVSARGMDQSIGAANRLYAYHTGDDGNILYGETGDPESVRPAEGRGVEEDLAAWKDLLAGAEEAELARYGFTLASSFPELLASLDEADRARLESLWGDLASQSLLSRKAEFEALLAREERLFTARRTGDIWSLRKQSENESARAISSLLIRDAEALCAAGIASLEEKIEAAKAGAGDLSLAGEDWLEAFRDQFDRGLEAWTAAEERFLVRRLEWERDSGQRYTEGGEAWKNAFAGLERERLLWEEKVRELFASGEALFGDVSEKLSLAIGEAREEFRKDGALRIQSGKDRAAALADMYVTAHSVLAEARQNAGFWLSRFVPGAPEGALETGTLGDWVRETMNARNLTENQAKAGEELIRWSSLFTSYQNKARESLEIMEREFALVMGMDGPPLVSVLGSSSEDFFLDEFQVELLRARSVSAYWEQRLSIAEAVSAYAEDLSAGRLTEAESLAAWREAKARYDEALAGYGAGAERLKNAGLELADIQAELKSAAGALLAAEQKMDELNGNYARLMASYRLNSGDLLLRELGAYYTALSDMTESRLE
ncbi:MAG: hypothetical protein LBD09_06830, partial [Treponema sp.]|nr:hypothetical protein [Treponema sp.]